MMRLANFLSPLTEEELRDVYRIDVNRVQERLASLRNDSTVIEFSGVSERTGDGNKLTYSVKLYLESGDPVLDREMERWLSDNKRLLQNPEVRAKVAFRVKFYCRSTFRGAGLATYLIPREEDAFRKWGAREIHVLAMDDGLWVWTRPQFGYTITQGDLQSLKQKHRDWQRARGSTQLVEISRLDEFPRDFFETGVSFLSLFKVI
jgi:GNAT superfamily N-acetyltransferase